MKLLLKGIFAPQIRTFFSLLLLSTLSTLVACGGGGDGNASPTANSDSLTVDEGASATTLDSGQTSVLDNDTDPESDSLTASLISGPSSSSSFSLNADGSFSYAHDGSETTSDSFTYVANDGTSNSANATVTITINPIDDPTVLAPDANAVTEDAVPDTATGNVLTNDSDPDTVLTVSNAAAINGTGTYGTLTIDNTGAYSYMLDNANAMVDALNNGDSLTDVFTYEVNGGPTEDLTITINGSTDGAVNISGVWEINTTVTADNPVGCAGGVGATDKTNITVKQTGNALDIRTTDNDAYTGTIDTGSGTFNVTASSSNLFADLTNPTDDTAFINWTESFNATGTGVTATSLNGSVTTIETIDGATTCTFSEDYVGTFIYQHTGNENYSGVYAFEIFSETADSSGGSDAFREGFPLEVEITGSTIAIHLPDDGPAAINDRYTFSNESFDPASGFFTITLDEVERNDNDKPADGVIDDSSTGHIALSGIFLRDPAATNGTDGTPLVVWANRGYARGYAGDVDAGGTPVDASNFIESAYGKRLLTGGMTRTILFERGDQTDEARILVGLNNPPLKRLDIVTSTLYIEVLNGSDTILCSVPYIGDVLGDGRYFEQINMGVPPAPLDPDFEAFEFRSNNYSSANCNTSNSGVDQVVDGETLTVRVLDTGANGINDGNTGDDVIAFSTTYAAEVIPAAERFTETPKVFSVNVNGAQTSSTLGGRPIPLFGYFDLTDPLPISWPAVAGADSYQIRAQETGVDDFVKWRFGTTGTSLTIPAGALDMDEMTLRLLALDNTTSNSARGSSYARRLNIVPGIRGLINLELGNALPLSHQTLQVFVQDGACIMTSTIWPASCSTYTVNFAADTVTLSMQDDASGTYTGTPNGFFTLVLHFSDAKVAEITSPDGIPGVPATPGSNTTAAMVASPEFYLRTQRMSHNGVERSRVNINNSLPLLYTRAVLSREDGTVFGDGVTTELVLWDEGASSPYLDVATESTTAPTNDGNAQRTKLLATFSTNGLGFGNVVLASGVFKLVLVDQTGTAPNQVFRYNYTAPSAANFIAPDDTTLTLDGTNCSMSTCNDPAAPITISSTPSVSWAVDASIPVGSYWRVIFRPTDSTGDAASERMDQVRTPFMLDGDFGLSISGTTATWTNPGTLQLPAGTYEVQIFVLDNDAGFLTTVLGSTSGPGGVGNDLTYVTVP